MGKKKKGERKSSEKFEVCAVGDSKNDNDKNIGRNDMAASSGSTGASEESANPNESMSKKKKGKKGNVKSTLDTHAAMQSDGKMAKDEIEKATDKGSDNPTSNIQVVGVSEKSKKKRRRRKSALEASGNELMDSAKSEEDVSCLNKSLYAQDILKRIIEIESGVNEPQSIQYSKKYRSYRSLPQEVAIHKRVNSSKDIQVTIPAFKSCIDHLDGSVIYVQHKSTQTDPLPEPPIISKPSDDKSTEALNYYADSCAERQDSDNTAITELKEPDPPVPFKVLDIERQDSDSRAQIKEPDPPIPFEVLNLERQDPDRSAITELKEPDPPVPFKVLGIEKYLEDINIRNEACFNVRPLDPNLLSIKEDLLRDVKIAAKKFEEGYIKTLSRLRNNLP